MGRFLTREAVRRAFGDGPAGAAAMRLARPSARFRPVDDPARADVQLGGVPLLPKGVRWPVWDGLPLDFVADVDLAGVHRVLDDAPLPARGRLFFFVAAGLFGPRGELVGALEPRSRPGWRVLLVPEEVERRPAEPPPVEPGVPVQAGPVGPFPAAHGELVGEVTVPDPFESGMPPEWEDDAVFDAFDALDLGGWSGPFHRVGGWPQPTQSAPAAPVAMAAAGLVTPEGEVDWQAPEVEQATASANDEWWLLLQLDTDDAGPPGWMWGDAGVLFFYGRPEQLRRGEVDDVWCNWDCH